jgi:hypothetical protein
LKYVFSHYGLAVDDSIENVYVGDFTLEDNHAKVDEISIERYRKLREIEQELSSVQKQEKDPIIRAKLSGAIRKVNIKKHIDYSEYKAKFSSERTLPLKNKINELNEKERRNEQQTRKDEEFYNYNTYKPLYEQKTQEIRADLERIESFQNKYDSSIKGYMVFLKKNLSQEAYKFYLKPLLARIPIGERKKHTYVVAQTGSGKSEILKMLAYGDIEAKNRAVVIIDPHGDMVEEIARFKRFSPENNYDDLVYIDPTLKNGFSPSINPFEIDDTSENNIAITTQELKRVINTLLQGSGATAQMEAILSPCISVLLRKKDGCFEDLQRFMDDKQNSDLIQLGLNSPNPQHAKLFRDKFTSSGYESTKHGIYTRMQTLLNDPIFQNLISNKTTVDLKKLIDQRKTILFKLSLGEGGSESMEAFGRFIVGMLRIIAIQRSKTPKEERTPTFFYIDEFQNFVSEDIEKALTQLRKYGLHLVLANQYVGQNIDTQLQKALFSSGVKIIGKNEIKTAKSAGGEIDVKYDEIKNLKVGEFFIQNGSYSALKIKVPTILLGNNNAMTNEEWQQVEKHNLGQYYNKTGTRKKAPAETNKNNFKAPITAPKFEI